MIESLDEFFEDEDIDEYDVLSELVRKILARKYKLDPEDFEELVEEVTDGCEDKFHSLLEDCGDVGLVRQDEELLELICECIEEELPDSLPEDTEEYEPEEEEWDFFDDWDEPADDLPPELKEEGYGEAPDGAGFWMFGEDDLLYSRDSRLSSRFRVGKDDETNAIGHSRQNLALGFITNYYDNDHHIVGYSRPSRISGEYTNYYDEKGKLIGFSRKSRLNGRYTVYFDSDLKLTGASRESFLGNKFRRYFKKKK